MVRMQVQLSRDQQQRLRRWAADLGVSLSEVVRRCIDAEVGRAGDPSDREARSAGALAVCGKYRDPRGSRHVGLDHDEHLADAFR
jgi:hypothetical protein